MSFGKSGIRAKQRKLNSISDKMGRKILIIICELAILAVTACAVCGIALGIGIFKSILSLTPVINANEVIASGQATIVYDADGNEIDQYVSTNSNRIEVGMDDIPELLGKAFVAIEDERFYQHKGIDYKGIIRSGYQFIKTGGSSTQGASTITQQLLKNTIFTSWTSEGRNKIKKIKRKIQEQYLALEITKAFPKEEILLRYMNAINLGQNTLGVESASLRYFGKSCKELTLSECAVIACITQNPSYYNPISHPDHNQKRRGTCLSKMLDLGFINEVQYNEAIADTESVYARINTHNTDFKEQVQNVNSGSYFSDAVYEQVKDDLIEAGYSELTAEHMLVAGGLRIYSTLNPQIQAIASEEYANESNFPANINWYLSYALTIYLPDGTSKNYSKENMTRWYKDNGNNKFNLLFKSQDDALAAIETFRTAMLEENNVENIESNYGENYSMTPQPQSAIVIEDQSTGYVVAMVGGRGVKEGRRTLNRATSANRSPGSTFKVVAAFAPALDACGQTLATTYYDGPFNYSNGTPVKNWYKGYRGINSIRDAITQSLNIVAIKTITVVTPQLAYNYLINFGFTTLTDGTVINGEVYSDVTQSLGLGGITFGVSPFELNAAYATIANDGMYVAPKMYSKVTDASGNIVLDNTTPATRQVLKSTTASLLTNAMVDVVTQSDGTATSCNFGGGMSIAGKTGTSTSYYDVWFTGYTPYYTCTVWSGYDSNGVEINDHNLSKKLWRKVMERVHKDLPAKKFEYDSSLVRCTVCSKSGKLPIPGLCDGCLTTELFAPGTVPTETCNVHYQGRVCAYDNVPACEGCPFAYDGVLTLPLPEPDVLKRGNSGSSGGTHFCQHDASFFANPDAQSIIEQQNAELLPKIQAAEAAKAAAEAAAQQAAPDPNAAPQ